MRLRSLRAGVATAVLALMVGACGSVGEESSDSGGEESSSRPIKVGLVIPQSGVYAPLGEDMKAGWDLWLEQHGGKIGGRDVETVVVDEGEGPDTGVPAVQKVLQQDRVDAVVGIVNSATALGSVDVVNGAKKLLIVANAGADQLTGSNKYIWRTSFTNGQVGYAVGKHLATTPEGKKGVYAMGADYAAGEEAIAGFTEGLRGRRRRDRRPGDDRRSGRRRTSSRSWPRRAARARGGVRLLRGRRGRLVRQAVRGVRPLRPLRRCTARGSSPRAAC